MGEERWDGEQDNLVDWIVSFMEAELQRSMVEMRRVATERPQSSPRAKARSMRVITKTNSRDTCKVRGYLRTTTTLWLVQLASFDSWILV